MHRRARRIALPICAVMAALALAPPASAASGNLACTASLTPQGSFENSTSGPIALQGSGTCLRNNAVQTPASFTFNGNATIANCFALPYIDITGTLTTSLVGGPTESTSAELQIESLAGVNDGVGILTTGAGQVGAMAVSFQTTDHPSVLGTVSRCGGADFAFTTTGAFVI
jgi:hypothetical protein